MTAANPRTRRQAAPASEATEVATAPAGDMAPLHSASREARRLAAAVLEVLAGLHTPSEAARAVGVSLARYYQLEQRALDGLVAACEPRRRGRCPGGNPAGDLRRECERLRRECARQQALVRATRRSVGLAEPPDPPATPEVRPRRRKRRPTARALRAAALLRDGTEVPAGDDSPAPGEAAASPPA
jgi:hypothetical protein